MRSKLGQVLGAAAFVAAAAVPLAEACTRVVFVADNGLVITGRSLDWAEDMRSDLWAFPRGIARDGGGGTNTPKWTSKYGSVVTAGYNIGTTDGLNEKGLVANMLYLAESDYGNIPGKPVLSISLWAQYALDNFATVDEAVKALSKDTFQIVAPKLPNGRGAQLHLSLSDATGDSAILEYVGGKLVIHHGKQFRVMTNSPTFDQQLAMNAYWKDIGGDVFLPGTFRASDRFARASYLLTLVATKPDPALITAVPDQKFEFQAAASVLSIMRAVSVPLGLATPGQPNIASTLWRSVADSTNKIYMFDSATSPNAFWVPLADLDLKEGAPVRKLPVAGGKVYQGNAADKFVPTPSFVFLPSTGL